MSTENLQASTGLRYNEGKLPWGLLPWKALTEVVKVLKFGATKYAPRNWEKGLSFTQTFESLQRHLLAWFEGEERDPETGELHLAHVATNALFLIHYAITGVGTDDRPNSTANPGPDVRRSCRLGDKVILQSRGVQIYPAFNRHKERGSSTKNDSFILRD